jgi:hypothetical protein
MTPSQKLDQVIDKIRVILNGIQPKVNDVSTERIISAWLHMRNVNFGYMTPLEMVTHDYKRVLIYLDYIEATSTTQKEKYDEFR